MRNENHDYDKGTIKIEHLGDGAGATFLGLTERDDTKYLSEGMTIESLAKLYKKDMWKAIGIVKEIYKIRYISPAYEKIINERIYIRLIDLGVNCGMHTAIKMLQRAAENCGVVCKADGIFGPATLAAIHACDGEKLHGSYKRVALAHYKAIVANIPDDAKFLDEWEERLKTDEYSI